MSREQGAEENSQGTTQNFLTEKEDSKINFGSIERLTLGSTEKIRMGHGIQLYLPF